VVIGHQSLLIDLTVNDLTNDNSRSSVYSYSDQVKTFQMLKKDWSIKAES